MVSRKLKVFQRDHTNTPYKCLTIYFKEGPMPQSSHTHTYPKVVSVNNSLDSAPSRAGWASVGIRVELEAPGAMAEEGAGKRGPAAALPGKAASSMWHSRHLTQQQLRVNSRRKPLPAPPASFHGSGQWQSLPENFAFSQTPEARGAALFLLHSGRTARKHLPSVRQVKLSFTDVPRKRHTPKAGALCTPA